MDQDDQTKDSTKKAAQTAANMYAGPVGGAAVDALSKTKLGDAVLAKGAESLKRNNPQLANALNKANESGALDAATAISGSGASGAPSSSGSAPASSGTSPSSSMGLGSGGALASKSKGLFGSSSSDSSSSESDSSLKTTRDKVKKINKWLPILGPIIGWFLIILIGVCGIIAFVVGPADTVIQFFRDKWEDLKTLVGYKSEEDWELEYYKRLEEVQEELNYKYGVCIDVNLITATLTVDMGTDELVEKGHPEEEFEDETGIEVESKYDYKKMIKQVELLGTMQIKRKVYGLDRKVKEKNKDKVHESTRDGLPVTVSIPAGKDYCRDEEEELSEYALLSDEDPYLDVGLDERIHDFNLSDAKYLSELQDKVKNFAERFKGTPVRNSKNARYVAANDIQPGIFKFFAKKANEEKNIQYTFYVPAYTYTPHHDQNGRLDYYTKTCELDLPQSSNDFAELDIGSLNDYENNVYYWNLIDNFIEEYYADYLPHTHGDEDVVELEEGWISTESKEYKAIKNIVEDIYLLYNEMGPNRECKGRSSFSIDCSNVDVSSSSLTKEEFIAGINNRSDSHPEWQLIVDNAEQIYDVAVANGVNPEIVVSRAIQEGFAPGSGSLDGNYNIWGWGAVNGEESTKSAYWGTWDEALEGFISGFKKSFPTNDSYKNYAYLGDYWYNPGGAGLGGCYYKDYIFPDGVPERVQNACDPSKSGTCTKNNTSNCVETTEEEREAYRQYQLKKTNDIRSNMWGLSADTCGSYGIQEGNCVIFSQADGRWSGHKLFTGKDTIGKSGCYLTSVSIAMTCSGRLLNPGSFSPLVLNNTMTPLYTISNAWFDTTIFNNVSNSLAPGFRYIGNVTLSGSAEERLNTISSTMAENRVLILYTTHIGNGYSHFGSHFEVLSAVDDGKLRMLDPAGGKISYWDPIYANSIRIFGW